MSTSRDLSYQHRPGTAEHSVFHDKMRNDPDFYVFEHHHTGSENTIDALPALIMGCLPYYDEDVSFAQTKGRSIGYEFKSEGYATASFSSCALDDEITGKKWRMLYDMLVGRMNRAEDVVHSPDVTTNNRFSVLDPHDDVKVGRPLYPLRWDTILCEPEGHGHDPRQYLQNPFPNGTAREYDRGWVGQPRRGSLQDVVCEAVGVGLAHPPHGGIHLLSHGARARHGGEGDTEEKYKDAHAHGTCIPRFQAYSMALAATAPAMESTSTIPCPAPRPP
mmetsp:Transcript_41267/g.87938  ORF Transcript_41267/g.87938 Transcript_41267/m.87938 type:complete len:276 (-) Transcript_41267:59-886(-)